MRVARRHHDRLAFRKFHATRHQSSNDLRLQDTLQRPHRQIRAGEISSSFSKANSVMDTDRFCAKRTANDLAFPGTCSRSQSLNSSAFGRFFMDILSFSSRYTSQQNLRHRGCTENERPPGQNAWLCAFQRESLLYERNDRNNRNALPSSSRDKPALHSIGHAPLSHLGEVCCKYFPLRSALVL